MLLLLFILTCYTQIVTANSGAKCLFCTIVTNEIEGFITENKTSNEITNYITGHICVKLKGNIQEVCTIIAKFVPFAIEDLFKHYNVSTVCNDLHLCNSSITQSSDPQIIPKFKIDLNTPPIKRWQGICALPQFQSKWITFIDELDHLFGKTISNNIEKFGRYINGLMDSEYGQEIQGCAQGMFGNLQDARWGWLTILNIGYEISDACTSIVAEMDDGTMIHGRNMDFSIGGPLTNTLRDVTIELYAYQGNELKFISTTFVGFVGVLSGQKPRTFSVTVNTRFYPKGILQLFGEIIVALNEKNYTLVSFLTRDALTKSSSFDEAMTMLSNTNLISDVYYTVAGSLSGQGAVISRNRTAAADTWTIKDSKYGWFVLETNYDHWKKAPWYDDRRFAGVNAMETVGQQAMSIESMYYVLSTKPVLNIQTVYSFFSIPKNYYHSVKRYCQYPCVE